MRQRGFVEIIVVIGILVLLAIGGAYYFGTQKNQTAPGSSPSPIIQATPSLTPTPDATTNWKSEAENTVSIFMDNINGPSDGNNINIAFSKLTSGTQARVKAQFPNSIATGLGNFVGVQEGPDKGTSITSSEKLNDGTVKVLTEWKYTTGSSINTFTLVLEEGQWKIDKVQ